MITIITIFVAIILTIVIAMSITIIIAIIIAIIAAIITMLVQEPGHACHLYIGKLDLSRMPRRAQIHTVV